MAVETMSDDDGLGTLTANEVRRARAPRCPECSMILSADPAEPRALRGTLPPRWCHRHGLVVLVTRRSR